MLKLQRIEIRCPGSHAERRCGLPRTIALFGISFSLQRWSSANMASLSTRMRLAQSTRLSVSQGAVHGIWRFILSATLIILRRQVNEFDKYFVEKEGAQAGAMQENVCAYVNEKG